MKWLLIAATMIAPAIGILHAQSAAATEAAGSIQSALVAPGSVSVLRAGDAVPAPAIVITNPSRWGLAPRTGRNGDKGYGVWGYAPDPYFYPEEYAERYALIPNLVVVPPVTQPAPPQQPPPPAAAPAAPVHSDIREYHWPASATNSSGTGGH